MAFVLGALTALIVALSAGPARASVSFVQSNTVAATLTSQLSVTTTLSSVTVGDLIVANVAMADDATISPPSGWTFIARADNTNAGIAVYYQYAASTSISATFTFSTTSGFPSPKGSGVVQLVELSGAASSSPVDATGINTGATSTATVTTSATTAAGDFAMAAFTEGSQAKNFGTPTSPWTSVGSGEVTSTTTATMGTYDSTEISTIGSTASESLSISVSAQWAGVAVTFKKAPLYWLGGLGSCPSGSPFSNASCWSTSSGGMATGPAPGATDVTTFDGGNGATGNCNLDATIVASISTTSGYTGTITQQNQDLSLSGGLSVGGGSFVGASGHSITTTGGLSVSQTGAVTSTFNGGGATVSVGTLAVTGGSFTEGAGNFTASGAVTLSGGTSTFSSGMSAFQNTLTVSGSSTSLAFGAGLPTMSAAASFSGGTVTYGSGGAAFNSSLTVSGASLTFGSTGPTISTTPTLSGGTVTFGTGAPTFNSGVNLPISGATVNIGSSAPTSVSGTVTVSGGALNFVHNNPIGTDFTNTGQFKVNGGTVSVGGATVVLGTTAGTSLNITSGSFSNTTAGGSVTVGASSTGSALNVGTSGTYNSVAGATEVFFGAITVDGSMTVGSASLSGSTNAKKDVAIDANATMTLTTSFSFTSGNAMTISGTLNAGGGTVKFTPAVTIAVGGAFNGQTSATTFNSTLEVTGTCSAGSGSLTVSGAGTIDSGGTFSAGSSTTKFSSTLALNGAFNANTSTSVTLSGVVSMTSTGTFNGNTATTTFSADQTTGAPLAAGTFNVGDAGTSGSVTFSAGASFGSGMTVAFPTSGGALETAGGQTLTFNGTVTSSAGALFTSGGAPNTVPKISRSSGGTGITVSFAAGTLNVDGLEFDNVVSTGVSIASGVTYFLLKHLKFQFNVALGAGGSRHLLITLGTALVNVPGCYFDLTAASNVELDGTGSGVTARAIFEDLSNSVNGTGAGETYDLDSDSNNDGVGDNVTTGPYFGSVVEWVGASETDTSGSAAGYPTPAFDWNNFTSYGVYVAYNGVSGGGGTLWNRKSDGSNAYSYPIPSGDGTIVGTPWWDTEGVTHVVYIATSGGRLIKLVDDGTKLARPTSGAWTGDVTISNITSITSPLIDDETNLYFGGMDHSSPELFAVQISTATLAREVGTLNAITATPSSTTVSGSTYVYLGSASTMSGANYTTYVYAINISAGTVPGSDTITTTYPNSVNDSVRFEANDGLAYAVTDGGELHAIVATDFFDVGAFTDKTGSPGFPYKSMAKSPIKFAPYIDYRNDYAYFGDNAGNLYVVTNTGSDLTGYPFSLGSLSVTASPAYVSGGGVIAGVIAVGASDGYIYFVNRHNSSNAPQLLRRYFVTSSGSVSSVSYDYGNSEYMVSSSDGKLVFINGADVADPDGTE